MNERQHESYYRDKKQRNTSRTPWILLFAPWVGLLLILTFLMNHLEVANLPGPKRQLSAVDWLLERFHLGAPINHDRSDTNRSGFVPTAPAITSRPDQPEIYRGYPEQQPSIPSRAENERKPLEFLIHADRQGHYRTVGTINGRQVNFLLDTGATVVSVPERIRWQLNLTPLSAHRITTASDTYSVSSTVIDDLGVGPFRMKKVEADLNPRAQNDEILLGMSALKLFELIQRNGNLTLRAFVGSAPSQTSYDFSPITATQETTEIKRPVRECMGAGKMIDQQALNCIRGN